MAGYIRQDTTGAISTNNIVEADDLNDEFNAVQGAFNETTGHKHDGTSAEGAPIEVLGPAQDVVVTASTVRPKTDNAVDLGTPTLEFKDLYLDGTANIDNLVADAGTVGGVAITTATNTQTLTNKTVNLSNNTLVATSAQLAAAITDETGTGSIVFSGSPALTGTPTAPTAGVGTNTTQLATTAYVVTERTATATLTNKTLTSPDINTPDIDGGTIDGAVIGAATPAAGTFTSISSSTGITGNLTGSVSGGTGSFTDLTVSGVGQFTSTGAVKVPVGTEAQRPTAATGQFRFNSDTGQFEGYNGTLWGSIGGGATGGGGDEVFVQNGQTVTSNYTIPADKNAMSTGPITINAGVTVTVSTGARYVVI